MESPTSPAFRDSATQDDESLVLLIHGTFAGSESSQGSKWWQCGGAAGEQLARRLPAGVRMQGPQEVFHWSGENHERARIKAGRDLFRRMEELEQQGRSYHLVGHSHGGSVIWHALRLAALRRRALAGLKSWITVGTPFLHFRSYGVWNPVNIFNLVLAALLARPAWKAMVAVWSLVWAGLRGESTTVQLGTDEQAGYVAVLRAPFLRLLQWLRVDISSTAEGVRLGSYDPASGESFLAYLFTTGEGLAILAVILLASYVFLNLALFFLTPVLESLRIRAELRLERRLMQCFGRRWLGVRSTHDEAINGLRATLRVSMSFVAQMAPQDRVLVSDNLQILARPIQWVVTPLFNGIVRPWLDRLIRLFVVKAAQGNNRPAAELVEVTTSPMPHRDSLSCPPLPKWLDQKVISRANDRARDVAPQLRSLLAAPSFLSGLEAMCRDLSGDELVHTSYFEHPEVLELIARRIALIEGAALSPGNLSPAVINSLDDWLAAFDELLASCERVQWRSPPPSVGVRPRRRHPQASEVARDAAA